MVKLAFLFAFLIPFVNGQTHHHGTRPTVSSQDHLLVVLKAMHSSETFHHLSPGEKIIMVELIAAAETDTVTHYVDAITMPRLLLFLDHCTRVNFQEVHLLEKYLVQELTEEATPHGGNKRDLTHTLQILQHNAVVQNMPQEDQTLLEDLVRAAENNVVTPLVHRVGYARIIQLVEDIGSAQTTHQFLTYLVNHMNQESHAHGTHHN